MNPQTSRPVGVSKDFLDSDGRNVWGDIGLSLLDGAGIGWEYLPDTVKELRPEDIDGRPAIIFADPAVTAESFAGVSAPPKLLARFGVGYDAVDVAACSEHGTLVTITPDGARRPVATAALTMLLASFHRVTTKDRLTRTGRWDERTSWMGTGLTGKTVGLLGVGNVSSDLVGLLRPFGVTVLGSDPFCPPERAAELGVELLDPLEVARRSDAVIILAALTPATRHLVDADFLTAMPKHAHLINMARGPIVNEAALIDALTSGSIAGAAIDVFEREPVADDNPLLTLDTVTVTPHSVAWTDEMSWGNGTSAVQAVIDVVNGRTPRYALNADAIATQ